MVFPEFRGAQCFALGAYMLCNKQSLEAHGQEYVLLIEVELTLSRTLTPAFERETPLFPCRTPGMQLLSTERLGVAHSQARRGGTPASRGSCRKCRPWWINRGLKSAAW
ncbi:hypothetical protein BDR05DRAFT_959581 [Suillus weaverae]|nr:hypothetical protein BDR05DRAFT_959581 [Suillus weaverae]